MKFCVTCRFFELHDQDSENGMDGVCRRASPFLQGLMNLEALPVYWNCAVWPETFENDWCGEWREKNTDSSDQSEPEQGYDNHNPAA